MYFALSSGGLANWEKFQKGINQYSMYDPDDPALYGLLDDMTSLPIIDVGKYTQNQ